jgi:hypothetical protein
MAFKDENMSENHGQLFYELKELPECVYQAYSNYLQFKRELQDQTEISDINPTKKECDRNAKS